MVEKVEAPSYYTFKKSLPKENVPKALEYLNGIRTAKFSKTSDISNAFTNFVGYIGRSVEEKEVTIECFSKLDKAGREALIEKSYELILPRLAEYLKSDEEQVQKMKIVAGYCLAFEELKSKIETELFDLFFPQMINTSSCLIDNKTAVKDSFGFLDFRAESYSLSKDQQNWLNEGKEIFYRLIDTKTVKYAINAISKQEGFEFLLEKDIEKKIQGLWTTMEVKVARKNYFWGMVGLDEVWIDSEVFASDNRDKICSILIRLLFHEGFHYAIRKLQKNFASLTPPSKNPKYLEAGYLFEYFLFGHYNIPDSRLENEHEIILHHEHWNKEERPLFTKDKLQTLVKEGVISHPTCSGLYLGYQRKIIM